MILLYLSLFLSSVFSYLHKIFTESSVSLYDVQLDITFCRQQCGLFINWLILVMFLMKNKLSCIYNAKTLLNYFLLNFDWNNIIFVIVFDTLIISRYLKEFEQDFRSIQPKARQKLTCFSPNLFWSATRPPVTRFATSYCESYNIFPTLYQLGSYNFHYEQNCIFA